MRFLHEEKDLFRDVLFSTADSLGMPVPIVEKDYYVTMVLRLLNERAPRCVFKGGTSLSKCHHVIDRFSEDIDITFAEHVTLGQRQKLKHETIAGISETLGIPIPDWNNSHSRRDFNRYTFAYSPIDEAQPPALASGVILEVVLGSTAFPVERGMIDSYVYQFLKAENMDIVDEYSLAPFAMQTQSLSRTFIDKVFAICDYYLKQNETVGPCIARHSRHIYDLYMIRPRVVFDAAFHDLVQEVRAARVQMGNCPSALPDVDVPALLYEILRSRVYEEDYRNITAYFLRVPVSYSTVTPILEEAAQSGMFS